MSLIISKLDLSSISSKASNIILFKSGTDSVMAFFRNQFPHRATSSVELYYEPKSLWG